MSGIYLEKVAIYDGIPTGDAGVITDVTDADFQLITTTLPVTLLSFPVPKTGNYLILTYDTVTTGSNSVLIVVNWTDAINGPQSFTVHSANHVVGSYPETPAFFNALIGTLVTLVVTIGHANQVYISAETLRL